MYESLSHSGRFLIDFTLQIGALDAGLRVKPAFSRVRSCNLLENSVVFKRFQPQI